MIRFSLRAFILLAGIVVFTVFIPQNTTDAKSTLMITPVDASASNTVEVPAPSPTTVPSESSPSPEAQKALLFIAQREGISITDLLVANELRSDATLLARSFQAVTILDRVSGRSFQVLVDRSTQQIEDWTAVKEQQEQVYQAKYGKLQPDLYERLQQIQDTDVITVTIFIVAEPGQTLADREGKAIQILSAKYPEVQDAVRRGGKPMEVSDPGLSAKIEAEYRTLLTSGVDQQIQPLVQALQAQGFAVSTSAGLPAVTAVLPKQIIKTLTVRSDVGTIYLTDVGISGSELNSAVSTDRVPSVRARGFDGSGSSGNGVKIAFLDFSNIDFTSPNTSSCPASSNNCFLRPDPAVRVVANSDQNHATLVASVAASNNSTYMGVAPGARVLSAGMIGTWQDTLDALVWALVNQSSDIVNMSSGFWCTNSAATSSRALTALDKAFDYYASSYDRLVVKSAGNRPICPADGSTDNVVTSPGRGWNVLTVGSSNDNDNSDWSDDVVAYVVAPSYGNPFGDGITPEDREKPEVVAPGDNITGIEMDGHVISVPLSGTSLATPQVAGLAALLIHRNSVLTYLQEVLRAIIMATATNNVDGPTGIPTGTDLKDGAGSINADLADIVATTRGATPSTSANACNGPCWWGECIARSTGDSCSNVFDTSGFRNYYFIAQAGDRIRVTISWDSYADCISLTSCTTDQLSEDFQLQVRAPDGSLLSYSNSWENNYELVPPDGELILPQTGTYHIAVYKQRFDASRTYLGVAWTKLPSYGPSVSSWGANRLDVFVRGGDNAIWWKSFNGSVWSAWSSLGGGFTSDPDAAARGSGKIDVFARGLDNAIYSKSYSSGAWASTWNGLGGGFLSGPGAASPAPNQLYVFGRALDNSIYYRFYNGSSWSVNWNGLGGGFTSDPDAVSRATNQVDVFARGLDNAPYYTSNNGSGWPYSKSTMVVKSCQKVYISHMSKPAMDKRNRYADT